jgi:protein-L-isoaspartate(D-aspartate) O-methyltransferase
MSDYQVARKIMVNEQLRDAGIRDSYVLEAMREVPRHLFVPRLLRPRAYLPCALPIGYGQTISQPFTVGLMTALLELRGHEKILEVGTGSGYQAAVLSRLTHTVLTVERIAPLADRARRLLQEVGCDNVEVYAADGNLGLPLAEPFDTIVVTACVNRVPEPLLSQLKDGGRLLVPLGQEQQQSLYRYVKRGTKATVERSVSCQFVPMQAGLSEGDSGRKNTPETETDPATIPPHDNEQEAHA